MQMTTLKAHRYANKQRKPGEDYEVRASDVRLLRALGWVKPKAPEPEPPAEPPRHDLGTLTAADRPKRAYRRRDMTAERAA